MEIKKEEKIQRCWGDRSYWVWQPTDWIGRLGVWREREDLRRLAGEVNGMSLTKVENRQGPLLSSQCIPAT